MKRKVTKWMAGISSAAMLVSFSALSVPAFAAEYEAMEAEAYVASFANEKAQTVARYFLDNGVSMEETEQMMDRYMNGLAMIEREQNANDGIATTSINTGKPYYSTTSKASTQHYGIFIIDDPTAEVDATLKITWDKAKYQCSKDSEIILNGYSDVSMSVLSTGTGVRCYATTQNMGMSKPLGVACFPFTVSTSLTTESAIKNAISFSSTVELLDGGNGVDSTFQFHTYAIGDFNHDGIVDDVDYTKLTDFCIMTFDGKFQYTNISDNVAYEVNTTAVDMNFDGKLDIRDAIVWNSMMN